MVEDTFWRDIINAIPIDLPEDGDSSELEEIPLEEKPAKVLKFSFDIYLISMLTYPHKHFMVTAKQNMEDLGTMTVGEATKKIKRTQGRRKKNVDE